MITPPDPNFEQRTRDSFAQQQVMQTLNAELETIEAGKVSIKLPYDEAFTQQDGFLHAGIVTTIVDSACGYAAYTLMPPDARVLTVEFKVNFMRPAIGDYILATGEVIRSGRTVTVCQGDVIAYNNGTTKQVALMQATMMTLLPT